MYMQVYMKQIYETFASIQHVHICKSLQANTNENLMKSMNKRR